MTEEEVILSAQTPTSSSKKKKSKKEKSKRKSRGGDGDDTAIEGVSASKKPKHDRLETPGSSSHKKKSKKDKKKKDKSKSRHSEVVPSRTPGEDDIHISQTELHQSQQQLPAIETTNNSKSIFSLITSPTKNSENSIKNSPFQIKTIFGTVALLPTSLSNVPSCIQSLLHSLLLMYNANMGGVLLSLESGVTLLPIDYEIQGSGAIVTEDEESTIALGSGGLKKSYVGGRITDDLPYVHFKFRTKGLLFCPTVGMKLKGQVIESTPSFLTLTTHHILSTKISSEKLHQQGFFYNSVSMEWTRERDDGGADEGGEKDGVLGPSTSIYLDDTVEFVVERIHECAGEVSLDGSHPSVSTM
mmetsp:Transcript_20603/g.42463  ORF Transcript_20603/g.42463 Transcript_20603/m.42463 type:complete len:357 (-) Transcript_20603:382-1452(-)